MQIVSIIIGNLKEIQIKQNKQNLLKKLYFIKNTYIMYVR